MLRHDFPLTLPTKRATFHSSFCSGNCSEIIDRPDSHAAQLAVVGSLFTDVDQLFGIFAKLQAFGMATTATAHWSEMDQTRKVSGRPPLFCGAMSSPWFPFHRKNIMSGPCLSLTSQTCRSWSVIPFTCISMRGVPLADEPGLGTR